MQDEPVAHHGPFSVCMITMRRAQVAAAGLVLLLAATATAAAEDSAIKSLANSCMSCHGTEGLKTDPRFTGPRIALQESLYILHSLQAYRNGQRTSTIMGPIASSLSEAQMRDVAAYIGDSQQAGEDFQNAVRTLPPALPPGTVPVKVVEVCGSCHGETGGGEVSEIPILTAQYADYLGYALRAYKSGARNSSAMNAIARKLSDAEIEQLSRYFSSNTSMPFALRSELPPHTAAVNAAVSLQDSAQDRDQTAAQVIQGIEMVDVPAGEYVMGDDASEGFIVGSPRHKVVVRAFRMGKYEVTFEQYDAFARQTQRPLPEDAGWGRGTRPAINLTWQDTQAFLAWLNKKTGRHFRLPSEAEWEYAARAGSTTIYWWGDDFKREYINSYGVSGADRWLYTAPTGQFPPNRFGLYDTSGNVSERVADCWHYSYVGAPRDARPWVERGCIGHVMRGGGWDVLKRPLRSSARASVPDELPSRSLGFRLAEDVSH